MTGAARIFLYNWPTYALTWGGSLIVVLAAVHVGGTTGYLGGIGASIATLWSVVSLAVSYYVYDRSELAGAGWMGALLPKRTETWASIDAGLDAEVAIDDVMPGTCAARLDIYDGVMVFAPSVRRARATTPRRHVATACLATSLPLADASCDVIAIVFTAHELRDPTLRERFFLEARRGLRETGRILLVEHLRDLTNFAAFGPGFFHFQPRNEWLRVARVSGLHVVTEVAVTPWVRAFALEKAS